jgi:hypothetical protein
MEQPSGIRDSDKRFVKYGPFIDDDTTYYQVHDQFLGERQEFRDGVRCREMIEGWKKHQVEKSKGRAA